MMLYNFLTAVVTIGVVVFIAIYNTSFISVVTLGGTVLGSAVIALGTALWAVLLQKLRPGEQLGFMLEGGGYGCIIAVTTVLLPGWKMDPGVSTMLFFLLLCIIVVVINDYTLRE
jgi:hypothetical protein